MQIDFASSGGVENEELAYHVDTIDLPVEQAKELERLVESSRAFELQQEEILHSAATGAGDVIAYRLTISEGARQNTLWFNDATAPTSLRPLLDQLRKLAMEEKRKGKP